MCAQATTAIVAMWKVIPMYVKLPPNMLPLLDTSATVGVYHSVSIRDIRYTRIEQRSAYISKSRGIFVRVEVIRVLVILRRLSFPLIPLHVHYDLPEMIDILGRRVFAF